MPRLFVSRRFNAHVLRLGLVAVLAGCASTRGADGSITVHDLAGRAHPLLPVPPGLTHVLIFITKDCPIANSYAPEINRIVADHADDPVRFFLVHVDPDVDADAASDHSNAYAFRCPVILDHEHRLVFATGVTVTPEAVVITSGSVVDEQIRYRGRIDDLYSDYGKRRREPSERDLRSAISAVLSGGAVVNARTTAIGCYIPDLP